MTDYYRNILGAPDDTCWNFDVAALYPNSNHDQTDLAIFTEAEALLAVRMGWRMGLRQVSNTNVKASLPLMQLQY